MKKVSYLALSIIILLSVSVVASSSPIVSESVEKVVEKKGFNVDDIQKISEVSYEDLPEEISIDNIDKTNLEIYQVELNKEKMFVLSFGGEKVSPSETSKEYRQFLNFGFNGEMNESIFLDSVGGVPTSADKGYVMMRAGSITGISTSLNIVEGIDSSELNIIIYKDGNAINFGNELSASDGAQKDYDTQSIGVVTFEAGDIISVKVENHNGIVFKDVITMIEITTN